MPGFLPGCRCGSRISIRTGRDHRRTTGTPLRGKGSGKPFFGTYERRAASATFSHRLQPSPDRASVRPVRIAESLVKKPLFPTHEAFLQDHEGFTLREIRVLLGPAVGVGWVSDPSAGPLPAGSLRTAKSDRLLGAGSGRGRAWARLGEAKLRELDTHRSSGAREDTRSARPRLSPPQHRHVSELSPCAEGVSRLAEAARSRRR